MNGLDALQTVQCHVWLFCGQVGLGLWVLYRKLTWCQHVEVVGDPRCGVCGRIPHEDDHEFFAG